MTGHAVRWTLSVLACAGVVGIAAVGGRAQAPAPPNPYHWDQTWKPRLPDGREWGSSAGVAVDKSGNIYVAERCGGNPLGCDGKTIDPIVVFNPAGKFLRSFGGGLFAQPCTVLSRRGRQRVGNRCQREGRHRPSGHQVQQRRQGADAAGQGRRRRQRPRHLQSALRGRRCAERRHLRGGRAHRRRLEPARREVLEGWEVHQDLGKKGTGPGEFDGPHCIAMDARGRLLVCDRFNNRIQIFDQEGTLLDQWKQFGRPSGIFINSSDMMFVIDSESKNVPGYGYNPGGKRGIRIGSAKDGKVIASSRIPSRIPIIPDRPAAKESPSSAASSTASAITGRRCRRSVDTYTTDAVKNSTTEIAEEKHGPCPPW